MWLAVCLSQTPGWPDIGKVDKERDENQIRDQIKGLQEMNDGVKLTTQKVNE